MSQFKRNVAHNGYIYLEVTKVYFRFETFLHFKMTAFLVTSLHVTTIK